MDVWLQRNKQCPACRTPITPGNPVKKIAGTCIIAKWYQLSSHPHISSCFDCNFGLCSYILSVLKVKKKKIVNPTGGLSHGPDEKDKMSNPELRKARFDLLFKEYEVSIDCITKGRVCVTIHIK